MMLYRAYSYNAPLSGLVVILLHTHIIGFTLESISLVVEVIFRQFGKYLLSYWELNEIINLSIICMLNMKLKLGDS